MKKLQLLAFLLLSCALVPIVLWTNQLWPFTPPADEPAFLGTTFGQTLAEVQEVLKGRGLQLTDPEAFKKEHPDIIWYLNFKPIHREASEITETWYLPPLEMFDSHLVGKFNFNAGKLTSVDLEVNPYYLSNTRTLQHAQQIAEAVTTAFKTQYQFIKNEPSKEIPGGYRLLFKGKHSLVDVWVNLSNQPDPVIYIYITYLPNNSAKEDGF